MQRIAIDMDEVMADTMTRYLDLYNADFNMDLTPSYFHGRRIFDVIPEEHREKAFIYFEQESFFASIEVMPGSQEVIRALQERYDVFVSTAAMDVPCSFSAKYHWLQKHFPFIPTSNIVFCGDKSIVAADYLIDDDPRHFVHFRGEGILFTAGHNVHETRYRRVNSWTEARELFLG